MTTTTIGFKIKTTVQYHFLKIGTTKTLRQFLSDWLSLDPVNEINFKQRIVLVYQFGNIDHAFIEGSDRHTTSSLELGDSADPTSIVVDSKEAVDMLYEKALKLGCNEFLKPRQHHLMYHGAFVDSLKQYWYIEYTEKKEQ